MQLPDEALSYNYQAALVSAADEWTPAAELRARYLIPPGRLQDLALKLQQVRSQVAAERDLVQPPAELAPLDAGFIDLPQKTLDEHRRKGDASTLGRLLQRAAELRDEADRVVVLGIGGS